VFGRIHPIAIHHTRTSTGQTMTVLIACAAVSAGPRPDRCLSDAAVDYRDEHDEQPDSKRESPNYDTAMGMPRKLTVTLAALMTAQSLTGVIAPEQYRDVEWIKATWFGNDWLTLVVAVPLLLTSSVGARRGSARAFLLCAGSVGYVLYNYAFYLFGAALNVFFPLYVVSVVLAAVILILTLGRLDPSSIALKVAPVVPVLVIAGSLVMIGLGLVVVWTAMWAAYAFGGRPTPVEPDAFRLVAALDLSLMVPAFASGGVLLWRRRPWGVVLAAIAGVQGSLYLAVLSINSLIAIQRGLAMWPGELIIWGPLAAFTVTITSLLLSGVREGNQPRKMSEYSE